MYTMNIYKYLFFLLFLIKVNAISVRLCTGCVLTNNQEITKKCCFETKNHIWNNEYSNFCFTSINTENDFENCCKNNDCHDHNEPLNVISKMKKIFNIQL